MKAIGRFLLFAMKWMAILGGIYAVATLFSELDFETRTGWMLFALAMGVAYVDGSLKDRVKALEYQVDNLERQLNGP